MATQSFDAVSIDDIVQTADVAKGTFYNHFRDKDELAQAVREQARLQVEASIAAANEDVSDPAVRVARALSVYARFTIDEPERAHILNRLFAHDMSATIALNKGAVDDVARGIAERRFVVPTTEAGVLFVVGQAHCIVAKLLETQLPVLAVTITQQLLTLLLCGLGLPAAEAAMIAAQAADALVRGGPPASAD